METRVCNRCNNESYIEMFGKSKKGKDGFKTICKSCEKEYNKKYTVLHKKELAERGKLYRKTNKEEIKERNKEFNKTHENYKTEYKKTHKYETSKTGKIYRETHKEKETIRSKEYRDAHKDKLIKYSKEYCKSHKEEISQRGKKYRETHKEEITKRLKLWALNNPEKVRNKCQRRRSKKLLLSNTLTVNQWLDIKVEFNNKCCYCGQELPLEQEHFLAMTRNGEYTTNNIIPCCRSCNASKGDKDFFRWYPKQKYYSKGREMKILKHLNYNKSNNQQLTFAI